jgi:hypothetical protein
VDATGLRTRIHAFGMGLATTLCLVMPLGPSFAASESSHPANAPPPQAQTDPASPGALNPDAPRKVKKRRHYLVKSVGFGFEYFKQGLTAKGSNGNDYLLTNQFTGMNFGWYQILNWKLRRKLTLGVSGEGFFGFANVTLNENGNPPAIFTYSAKNYFQFGARSFAELNYSHKRWVYSFVLGAGLGFLSLPAPNSTIAVSAPSSAQLFLVERLMVHYRLNPRNAFYAGIGALGGLGNLELVLGVKLLR